MKLGSTLMAGAMMLAGAVAALPAQAQPRVQVQFGNPAPVYVAPPAPVYVAPQPGYGYADPATGRDPYRFAQRMRERADQSIQRLAWRVEHGRAAPWTMRRAQHERARLEANLNQIVADGVVTRGEAQMTRDQVHRLEGMTRAVGGGPRQY